MELSIIDVHQKVCNEYSKRFKEATLEELVKSYNSQVGNSGWASAKARYLVALYQEFKKRKIDISIIDTGNGRKLDRHIELVHDSRRKIKYI